MMQGQMPPAPSTAKPMAEPEVIRNLMVNYIPTTIDEVQLRQLFEMYGPVESVKIVVDRETRTSKGYGFVKFRFSFSAVHAIQYLNGYPLMNKRLKVAYSNQAEAQKILSGQVPEATGYPQHQYAHAAAAGTPAELEAQQQMYMQQMYMQQLAALQMMQYSSMPQAAHQHHAHQHQHQHQQQQQQQRPPHMQHQQQQPQMQQSPAQPQQPQPTEGQQQQQQQ